MILGNEHYRGSCGKHYNIVIKSSTILIAQHPMPLAYGREQGNKRIATPNRRP